MLNERMAIQMKCEKCKHKRHIGNCLDYDIVQGTERLCVCLTPLETDRAKLAEMDRQQRIRVAEYEEKHR